MNGNAKKKFDLGMLFNCNVAFPGTFSKNEYKKDKEG